MTDRMWNLDRASVKYAGATVFLCLVALVGMLLPWATPKVVYMAGEPTVIDIGFGETAGDIILVTSSFF